MSYILQRMTEDDAPLTIDWMVRQYGFDRAEVESWVQDLHFNWPLSVKALDENGHVIGLLNMSDYRIEEETPQILKDKPELIKSLNTQRYIAVFSFIVAEEYRGTSFLLCITSKPINTGNVGVQRSFTAMRIVWITN